MEELHPSHYPARRAATLVQNYINYQVGTPHKVYLFGKVTQATLEDIPGRGHKYHLKFTLGEMVKNEIMVNCEAQVFYPTTGENTVPEVEYTFLGDAGKNTDEEDNKFYESLKSMKKPLKAKKIPDDYGYIPPELKPVRHLAIVASGYVIWQHSSEKTCYNMAWVENVKQVDMNPCQIQVLWHPQYGVKVKHYKRQLHRKQ
ncbi:latexin isoform 3-T3 [Sarcophilus harrisii]